MTGDLLASLAYALAVLSSLVYLLCLLDAPPPGVSARLGCGARPSGNRRESEAAPNPTPLASASHSRRL